MLAAATGPWVQVSGGANPRLQLRRRNGAGFALELQRRKNGAVLRLIDVSYGECGTSYSVRGTLCLRKESREHQVVLLAGEGNGVDDHQIIITDHPMMDAFSWGNPTVCFNVGYLTLRYITRASNRRGHSEWAAKLSAEQAANDSKAAA